MKILDEVKGILSDLSGIESIYPEQELQADLGLDSLQMITLLMMLEDNFEIVLNESDMNPFDLITVWNVVNLVEKYLGGDKSGAEES